MFFIPFSPFLNGFPLRSPDSVPDLQENLPAALADDGTQCHNCRNGVEVEDRHEVLMPHIFRWIQTAPAEYRISDAGGGCCLKLDSDVVIIVPF